jgi:hypothetical protein
MPSRNYSKDIIENIEIDLCQLEHMVHRLQNTSGGYFPIYDKTQLPHDLQNGQAFHVEQGEFCVYYEGSIFCMPSSNRHDTITNPWVLTLPTSATTLGSLTAPTTPFVGHMGKPWFAYSVSTRPTIYDQVRNRGVYFAEYNGTSWIYKGTVGERQPGGWAAGSIGLPAYGSSFTVLNGATVNSTSYDDATNRVIYLPVIPAGAYIPAENQIAYSYVGTLVVNELGYRFPPYEDYGGALIASDETYVYCAVVHVKRYYYTATFPGLPDIPAPHVLYNGRVIASVDIYKYDNSWSIIGSWSSNYIDDFEAYQDRPCVNDTGGPFHDASFPGVANAGAPIYIGLYDLHIAADKADPGHPAVFFSDVGITPINPMWDDYHAFGIGRCYVFNYDDSLANHPEYPPDSPRVEHGYKYNGTGWIAI